MYLNVARFRQFNCFYAYRLLTNPYSTNALAAGYKPKDVESEHNVFQQQSFSPEAKSYTFTLPPPNVTGNLHLGHALMCTIEDVIARWKRSQGYDVCWVPGMDHAGIATQVVVEKHLRKIQGLSRHDIGRKRFTEEVWKWKSSKGCRIKDDLIRMGSTLNWDKEYFTMDRRQSAAVIEAFIQLYEQGLIYRGDSLVNWSCSLESTISDIEIESLEINAPTALTVPGYERPIQFGNITDFSYRICGQQTDIVVSTTRPETMLGDVAVAVHPDDMRYSHLRDKCTELWHPFREESIPLVFDYSVDPSFGTGAVKITPAHDRFDFELAKRHSLPSIDVINEKGLICDGFGKLSGTLRFDAREMIKNDLATLGLFQGTKGHKMVLPLCSRSRDVIEQLLKPQWFVRCENMAKAAISVVESGELELVPANFRTEWARWLGESRDWCISRQLWWGHQIPAYKCSFNNQIVWVAARSTEDATEKCLELLPGSSKASIIIEQDSDVLDTWFSSALLPFSTLGWPDTSTAIFKRHYPQDLLETGHDILFFWVARMVMLSQQLTGRVPFKTVLLHGIVCDSQGRKMSKSLGNVVVPNQIIAGATLQQIQDETTASFNAGILSSDEHTQSLRNQAKVFPHGIPECGTDALRFTLCSHNIKSHFINFDTTECYTNKLFFNKIWQACRYTVSAHQRCGVNIKSLASLDGLVLGDIDRWILSRLAHTVQTINDAMEEFSFHIATAALKTFFYQNLCDIYLETTKPNISAEDPSTAALVNCAVLNLCLSVGVQHMKQFTPFLCQELEQHLVAGADFSPNRFIDDSAELAMEEILAICAAIRQLKSENNISKKHLPTVHLFIKSDELFDRLTKHQNTVRILTHTSQTRMYCRTETTNEIKMVAQSTAGPLCSFGIQITDSGAITSDNTTAIVNEKKRIKLETDLDRLIRTVSNETYQKSANTLVQQKHREKIERLQSELNSIRKIQQSQH